MCDACWRHRTQSVTPFRQCILQGFPTDPYNSGNASETFSENLGKKYQGASINDVTQFWTPSPPIVTLSITKALVL
jgi:hypothetical protein